MGAYSASSTLSAFHILQSIRHHALEFAHRTPISTNTGFFFQSGREDLGAIIDTVVVPIWLIALLGSGGGVVTRVACVSGGVIDIAVSITGAGSVASAERGAGGVIGVTVARLAVLVIGGVVLVADGGGLGVVALADVVGVGVGRQVAVIGGGDVVVVAAAAATAEETSLAGAGGVVVLRAGAEALLLLAVADEEDFDDGGEEEEDAVGAVV